jgi:hypothetical protein
MYLKKPATEKITIGEFRKISENLQMRGFVEEPKRAEQGAMHDKMVVSSYRRELSDFVLRVGASQEAADVIAVSGRNLAIDEMSASLWARCAVLSNRSIVEFAAAAAHKSHYVESSKTPMIYHADLVPYPDPSLIIDSCLRLASAIAKVRSDGEFAAAIDAKEVHEKISEARGRVRLDNSFGNYLDNYLGPLFDSLKKKMDYEYSRIMQDPQIVQALSQVADRE